MNDISQFMFDKNGLIQDDLFSFMTGQIQVQSPDFHHTSERIDVKSMSPLSQQLWTTTDQQHETGAILSMMVLGVEEQGYDHKDNSRESESVSSSPAPPTTPPPPPPPQTTTSPSLPTPTRVGAKRMDARCMVEPADVVQMRRTYAVAGGSQDEDDEKSEKKRRRLEKNRVSADASRKRTATKIVELKQVEAEFHVLQMDWHKREVEWCKEKKEMETQYRLSIESTSMADVSRERDELRRRVEDLKFVVEERDSLREQISRIQQTSAVGCVDHTCQCVSHDMKFLF